MLQIKTHVMLAGAAVLINEAQTWAWEGSKAKLSIFSDLLLFSLLGSRAQAEPRGDCVKREGNRSPRGFAARFCGWFRSPGGGGLPYKSDGGARRTF